MKEVTFDSETSQGSKEHFDEGTVASIEGAQRITRWGDSTSWQAEYNHADEILDHQKRLDVDLHQRKVEGEPNSYPPGRKLNWVIP